jgi:hypothetical protein
MSRLRVVLVIFTITACLIFTIFLRTSASRMFNQYRKASIEQKNLCQQLWQKQLEFECRINPAGLPSVTIAADSNRKENQ